MEASPDRTILFVGYSLSDLNIRFLLHRLWRTWRSSGFEKDRPRSSVFMVRPSPIEGAVLEQWGIKVVTEPDQAPEQAFEAFLTRLAETAGRPVPVAAPARAKRPRPKAVAGSRRE